MMNRLILATLVCLVRAEKTAGILYSVWHTPAAHLMKQLRDIGAPLLTVEQVIRSDGKLILGNVYEPLHTGGDIYAATPAELGFYCLYRPRSANDTIPGCENITQTATRHAKMLTDAGFDYIAIDGTSWPEVDDSAWKSFLRPTQVLFEEWSKLRESGVRTPSITVWQKVKFLNDTVQKEMGYHWVLDNLYNHPKYGRLVHKQDGKKLMFIPSMQTPALNNASLVAEIEANGGRNDVIVRSMWAFLDQSEYDNGTWAFFSQCIGRNNKSTTSLVGEKSCDQQVTTMDDGMTEISACGGYMISQGSLPFASPGHFRGLTVQRTFEKILNKKPPHIFMSSFNEWIGGRQQSGFEANTAINMGLPNDPQKKVVWVETYASEFSRDMEPSVEAGNRTWAVASSCVQLYKAGKTCSDSPTSLCCDRSETEIFANAWALRKDNDSIVATKSAEVDVLKEEFGYTEQCHPVLGPSVFCVNIDLKDAREGPFMLYSIQPKDTKTRALYRCYSSTSARHFLSVETCESDTVAQVLLGYVAVYRGGEMLRGLNRCKDPATGRRFHSLDLECDNPDSEKPLGFVR